MNSEDVELYEIVSENKLSAWNGKFSINDPIWEKVNSDTRSRINASLKTNHSFCMSASDVTKIFEDVRIFENNFSMNKDWVSGLSKNGVPALAHFDLKVRDKVFIRVSAQEKISHSVILARQIGADKFRYVTG